MLVVFSLLDQLELFLILLISFMNFYALGLLAWKTLYRGGNWAKTPCTPPGQEG